MKTPKPKSVKATGDITVAVDPASNMANAGAKAIDSLSKGIGGVFYRKEETKQTQIQVEGNISAKKIEMENNISTKKIETEGNITIKGLNNKAEIIKGTFNILTEVISCGKSYIKYLEVKENTNIAITQLDKEKEKTIQIMEETKIKIIESNNKLEEFKLKIEQEGESKEITKGKILFNSAIIMDLMKTTGDLRSCIMNNSFNDEYKLDYLKNLVAVNAQLVELSKINSEI